MSQGTRRRNAGLTQHFRAPKLTSEAPAPTKLWPASNPEHAVTWWCWQLDKPPLFVYFIQDERGPVKIGKAFDPPARLVELQCGNPMPLKLAAVVLAAPHTEKRLHLVWDGHNIQGEWFGTSVAARLIELAKRTQRQQIEAFKRGKPEFDITAMPTDEITPTARVRASVEFAL